MHPLTGLHDFHTSDTNKFATLYDDPVATFYLLKSM